MNSFAIKPQINFGANSLDCLMKLQGASALIITDKMMVEFGFANRVADLLKAKKIECQIFDNVISDPNLETIANGMQMMNQSYPDIVIALGGGSVIDAAKSMMYTLWCYNNKRGDFKKKPYFVAIPTTSGTGSEVTAFSVIKSGSEKLVIVDEWMLPDIAILDPDLVKSVPPKITADTGMDVLCHAIEAYVSTKANDFTDALAEKSVKLVFSHLIESYRNGSNSLAREKMHNASCLAGMAFTNASLGINHSLSHALGGVFGIAHGRANALLMPYIIEFNADIQGSCDNKAAQRYAELSTLLGLPSRTYREGVQSLVTAVRVLKEELAIPATLQEVGITQSDLEYHLNNLAYQALKDNCTPTNPRDVGESDIKTIYRHAFLGK